MPLLSLPNELLFEIAARLQNQKDINSLTTTCCQAYSLLNGYLYKYNIQHGNSSALLWALQRGSVSTAKKCLQMGADLEADVAGSDTPPLTATSYREPDVVRFLLESGANPNRPDMLGNTPLIVASRASDEATVRAL